jgi:hypothetical protein
MNRITENAFETPRAGGTRNIIVPIVGVRYMSDENYQAVVEALATGREVTLHNEDDNPVDVKAVAAYMDAGGGNTVRIGYVGTDFCILVRMIIGRTTFGGATLARVLGWEDLTMVPGRPVGTIYVLLPCDEELLALEMEEEYYGRFKPFSFIHPADIPVRKEERDLEALCTKIMNSTDPDVLLPLAERYLEMKDNSFCAEDSWFSMMVLNQLNTCCDEFDILSPTQAIESSCHRFISNGGPLAIYRAQMEYVRHHLSQEGGFLSQFAPKYPEGAKREQALDGIRTALTDAMPKAFLFPVEGEEEERAFAKVLYYGRFSRTNLYLIYAHVAVLEAFAAAGPVAAAEPKARKRPSARKPAKGVAKKPAGKPMTLKYYTHGNKGVLRRQGERVKLVFERWNKWGWIDGKTTTDDFDALFEGEPRHCNIAWKASTTVLTSLLQKLLKQPFIEGQKRQSASSMVREQFGLTPNFDRNRLADEDAFGIDATVYILDINNPLPQRKGGGDEDYDTRDAALRAVLSGELRSTKGI